MAIPDYQTIMRPLLELAADQPVTAGHATEQLAERFGLTADERDQLLPSGRQRVLHNRVHWARFHMARAGLMASPARGRFEATDAGRALLASGPAAIDTATLKTIPAYADFIAGLRKPGDAPDDAAMPPAVVASADDATPDEQIETAHAAHLAQVRAELLDKVRAQSPVFFEVLIAELLVAMGYGGSRHAPGRQLKSATGPDGGIDGVIDQDPLGLDRIYIQAKRYAPHVIVGRPAVQAFVGSLSGLNARKGVFVTTSSFSADARAYTPQGHQLVLVDGDELAELMITHGVGVRVTRTVRLYSIDEDAFGDDAAGLVEPPAAP